MNHPSRRRAAQRRAVLSVDPLEGRALLSGVAPGGLSGLLGQVPGWYRALPGSGRVKVDPEAVGVIRDALMGRGPAADFGAMVRGQLGNLPGVVRGFLNGSRTEYAAPGVAVKIPRWQDAYTGPHYDHLTATAAGAVYTQKTGQLQLGAVMRGLFDENVPSQVVFGLDRGAGGSIGPIFASRPSLTPDLLVTLTVAPNGTGATGTIRDLKTGTETAIDPARIKVAGATVRVVLDSSQIPAQGYRIPQYRFVAWTHHGDGSAAYGGAGIETVGSFVAERALTPIGVKRR